MVANWINTYKGSSAQIKVDGKPFHSTFEGFNWAGRWPEVKSRTGDLYLVPSWTYNGGVNGVAQNLDKVNGACETYSTSRLTYYATLTPYSQSIGTLGQPTVA